MKKYAWFFLVILLFLASCVKEEFNLNNFGTTNWNPNVAVPLVNTEMTFWDIMMDYDTNEVLAYDSNKLLYLVYEGQVESQPAEHYIQITDQNVSSTQTFSIPGGPLTGLYVTTIHTYIDFNLPNGVKLDTLLLKNGLLQVFLTSTLNYPALFVIKFGNSTQNGQPFGDTLVYSSPWGSSIKNLSGTKLIFDPANPNRLPVDITIYVNGDGSPNLSPYTLNFSFSLTNLRFSYVYGYLGQFNMSNNMDTLKFRIYNNALNGVIHWEDPRLYFYVKNSFGIPIAASFNYLAAHRTKTPQNIVHITGPGIPNPWNINYPTIPSQVALTQLFLNKTNTNLSQALDIMPQEVLAVLDAQTNPNGNVVKNFALDTSKMHVKMRAEFPCWGFAHGFVIQDTFNINLTDSMKNIEWILFRLYTRNGYPVDAYLQLYFLDSLNNIKDSLISPPENLIVSAATSGAPDYIVTQPTEKRIDVIYSSNRLNHLVGTRKILVKARLNTQNSPNALVKIYANYVLKVRLSAQIQFKFSYHQ